MALSRKPQEIVEDSKNPLLAKHESWERVPVCDIADILNGFAFKSSQFTNDKGVPLIRIRDVGKDSTETYYDGKFDETYLVDNGDLLVGMDGDFRCSIWKGGKALLNQRVCKISLKTDEYDFKFLSYVLQPYLDAIHAETSAVTVKHLSSRSISEIPLPLPPKEQQKRIVAKIEELFSHIDAGIEALKKAKQLLKQYRQSVLKAAVTGELTKEWREANKAKLEPASQLLERILKERRQKWEEQQLRQFTAKGLPAPKKGVWWLYVLHCDDNSFYIGVTEDMSRRWAEHVSGNGAEHTKKHKPISIIHHEEFKSQKEAYNREKELKTGFGRKWLKRKHEKGTLRQAGKMPKNDKWKEKYKEPLNTEFEHVHNTPEIPDTWVWVTVSQLTTFVKDGPHYSPKYAEKGIPFITGGNVRPNGVDFESCKYITQELHEELSKRCKPELLDILYTKGGTTGIARVNTYDFEFNVWVHVAVLRLVNTRMIEPFFMQHALNSLLCYVQSQKYTHGVGNQDLGLTRMVKICLALPPIGEQKEIIDVIDGKMESIDRIEEQVDHMLIMSEKNKQSVLASAFSGSL